VHAEAYLASEQSISFWLQHSTSIEHSIGRAVERI